MVRSITDIRAVACLMLSLLLVTQGYAQDPAPLAPTAADLDGLQPQFAQLRNAKGEFTMTILPVMVPDTPMPTSTVEFARVVALVLERTGLKSLEVSEKKFVPQSKNRQDLDTLCTEFSQYVQKNPVETDYVYFTEYFGTPQTGPKAILTVVANRKGQIVWKKRQAADDKDWQRFHPDNPMGCAFVSAEPVRRTLNLADPLGKDIYRGQWTQFYTNRMKQKMVEEVDAMLKRSVGEIDSLPAAAANATTTPKATHSGNSTAAAASTVPAATGSPEATATAAPKRPDKSKESPSESKASGGTAWIIAAICVLAAAGLVIGLAKRKGIR